MKYLKITKQINENLERIVLYAENTDCECVEHTPENFQCPLVNDYCKD